MSRRAPLDHPDTAGIDLLAVLHALSDPTRMAIVRTLRHDAGPERACGTFPVDVAPSTLTHHFRVLREAGVIRQREAGNRRFTSLRLADLDARFPGLLDAVLAAHDRAANDGAANDGAAHVGAAHDRAAAATAAGPG